VPTFKNGAPTEKTKKKPINQKGEEEKKIGEKTGPRLVRRVNVASKEPEEKKKEGR